MWNKITYRYIVRWNSFVCEGNEICGDSFPLLSLCSLMMLMLISSAPPSIPGTAAPPFSAPSEQRSDGALHPPVYAFGSAFSSSSPPLSPTPVSLSDAPLCSAHPGPLLLLRLRQTPLSPFPRRILHVWMR